MSEKKLEITGGCALVVDEYGEDYKCVAIRYIERSQDYCHCDEVTDADKAREIVALLFETFGPGVLPNAGNVSPQQKPTSASHLVRHL